MKRKYEIKNVILILNTTVLYETAKYHNYNKKRLIALKEKEFDIISERLCNIPCNKIINQHFHLKRTIDTASLSSHLSIY